jgi:hypothetical protein
MLIRLKLNVPDGVLVPWTLIMRPHVPRQLARYCERKKNSQSSGSYKSSMKDESHTFEFLHRYFLSSAERSLHGLRSRQVQSSARSHISKKITDIYTATEYKRWWTSNVTFTIAVAIRVACCKSELAPLVTLLVPYTNISQTIEPNKIQQSSKGKYTYGLCHSPTHAYINLCIVFFQRLGELVIFGEIGCLIKKKGLNDQKSKDKSEPRTMPREWPRGTQVTLCNGMAPSVYNNARAWPPCFQKNKVKNNIIQNYVLESKPHDTPSSTYSSRRCMHSSVRCP